MYCPHPQRYSRCASCQNVAFNVRGHTRGCENKSFISVQRTAEEAVAVQCMTAIKMRFMFTYDIGLLTTLGQKSLGDNAFHLRMQNLVVVGKDKNIVEITSLPTAGGSGSVLAYFSPFHLVILNEEMNQMMHLFVTQQNLRINGVVNVTQTGTDQNDFEMPRADQNAIKFIAKCNQPGKLGITIDFLGRKSVVMWYSDRPLVFQESNQN